MSDRYRVYSEVKTGVADDGDTFERSYGCNGKSHVYHDDKVSYRGKKVDFVEQIAVVYEGACDNSCGTEDRGGFLYPRTA